MDTQTVLAVLQIAMMMCVLFFVVRRNNGARPPSVPGSFKNSDREYQKLRALRATTLTIPLSERTRPTCLSDIVGQEDGIRALKAALCGANPQHVLIYGPPGIGKTCAARLVLEYAKSTKHSPFSKDAPFIEVNATCVRYDERSIADPLIGSVHDPIYQGAGVLGNAGIPQPKPGAVTRANGGVLFLDEIGELPHMQMNKLLKVLEDRKVFFESAYYSPDDTAIPPYIHDIFKYGMPADFRLIGATTKTPKDIPDAIRSRCIEIFFRPLRTDELEEIAHKAVAKTGLTIEKAAAQAAARYANSGREINNIVQLTAGLAMQEGRDNITLEDVEWVASTCRYRARVERCVPQSASIGTANGLAVMGDGTGMLIEIEALATPAERGKGTLKVTGVIDEEEMNTGDRRLRRKGTAAASVENALTALRLTEGIDARDYDIHINLPGGVPIDGPSAGIAIAVATASAILERPADCRLAMTGEVSIRGNVRSVGGIRCKLAAAAVAGATRVIIPEENAAEKQRFAGMTVITVSHLSEVLDIAFGEWKEAPANEARLLSASESKA
ncbi:MAG: ATP-dependent protease LonB [Christensenellales bacterium]